MASDSQIHANRQNAQLSTGPTSPEGRAKSSLNAVKTGLTGRTVLLPSDDVDAYQAHLDAFIAKYEPATPEESSLVQSLADTEWRLLRIPNLEMVIYAVGRIKLAAQFESEPDPQVRAALIDAETYLTYHKQLNNLHLQGTRLRRQRDKEFTELAHMQKERKVKLGKALSQCRELMQLAEQEGTSFDPQEFGFEFPAGLLDREFAIYDLIQRGYRHDLAVIRSYKAA